jgi:hypothetical protein
MWSANEGGDGQNLMFAGPTRDIMLIIVPTMQELGFPNFDYRGFVGLAAPGITMANPK